MVPCAKPSTKNADEVDDDEQVDRARAFDDAFHPSASEVFDAGPPRGRARVAAAVRARQGNPTAPNRGGRLPAPGFQVLRRPATSTPRPAVIAATASSTSASVSVRSSPAKVRRQARLFSDVVERLPAVDVEEHDVPEERPAMAPDRGLDVGGGVGPRRR